VPILADRGQKPQARDSDALLDRCSDRKQTGTIRNFLTGLGAASLYKDTIKPSEQFCDHI
jgi:hypothetical protein